MNLEYTWCILASLVAQIVKHLPAMQETQVQSLSWEDPLEKKMATHSSIPAWKIPWRRILVGYSPWDCSQTQLSHFTSSVFNSILISLSSLDRKGESLPDECDNNKVNLTQS